MKIYVYKEHCDENPYGEEIVELYEEKSDAVNRLKERVSAAYGVPFESVPETIGLDENDTFREDYVSINNGDGATSFWVVEEKSVSGETGKSTAADAGSGAETKKMFAVYGHKYNTGCMVFPSHTEAEKHVRDILSRVIRGYHAGTEGLSDAEILEKAKEKGEYAEDGNAGVYKGPYLEYRIEPVLITKDEFEKASTVPRHGSVKSLEIGKLLTISTAHISRETADLLELAVKDDTDLSLPVVFTKGEYGYVVHISEELTGDRNADLNLYSDTPEDLYKCQKLAVENGCDWLVLDRDGDIADGLPVYEW